MRLSTLIIRTPFGIGKEELAMFDNASDFEPLRGKFAFEHFKKVHAYLAAGVLPGPLLGFEGGYRDVSSYPDSDKDFDGLMGEWWTVISYDGPPFEYDGRTFK